MKDALLHHILMTGEALVVVHNRNLILQGEIALRHLIV